MACFDGQYPIELPAGNLIGKHLLEGVGKRAGMPAASPEQTAAAVAELESEYDAREHAVGALHHP
jgi:amidophosphoribosyltransferase